MALAKRKKSRNTQIKPPAAAVEGKSVMESKVMKILKTKKYAVYRIYQLATILFSLTPIILSISLIFVSFSMTRALIICATGNKKLSIYANAKIP